MRKLIVPLLASLLLASPALAAEKAAPKAADTQQDEMVVTATMTEEDLNQVPSTTFVVTDKEIEEKVQFNLSDALRDVPGVYIRGNGPFGGTTSLTMRGTQSGQTMLMLDGVRMADPISTNGAFDIANLLTGGIGQVEVVQGPQSTLYGSDAMAGAVNIITKRGRGTPTGWATVGYGSHNTWQGNVGTQGQLDRFNFMLAGTGINTDGISKAKAGSEDDPYYAYQFNGRVGFDINDNTEIYFIGYYNHAKSDYDGFVNGQQADTNDNVKTDSYTSILGLTNAPFSWWNHKLTVSYGAVDNDYEDGSDYNSYLTTAQWRHNLLYKDINTVTLGVQWQQEKGDYSTTWDSVSKKSVDTLSFYLQDQLKILEGLYLLGGVRNDNNDDFDDQVTWRVGASYTIAASDTTFKGTYGTGFKAPSLYQRYSPYGSTDLSPEKSKGWDLGVVQLLWQKRIKLGLTYFNIQTDDLISFDMNTWKYENLDEVKSQGVEFYAAARLLPWLEVNGSWTYTDAQDESTDKDLAYNPRDKGTLGVRLPLMNDRLNIRVWGLYVGDRYIDAANTGQVGSYVTVNAAATFKIFKWLSVYGNVINLFDEDYVEIQGYNTLGLSGFLGLRAEF
ncbi:MAG: TonB-dependent receptor [Desulfarculaceae bacterium]|nr:TonB-dependent receptor [Desulfarculaceae bacterium]MCF8071331.1 TonB-dependent receptor [Desulfarculaceae bacterium]MCF8101656.1 TonB-dependent receptor [Desulfarculaceae bacterium]MCF8116735.1 TonB-dependent receptor [Desulfarculaceae bacterium]